MNTGKEVLQREAEMWLSGAVSDEIAIPEEDVRPPELDYEEAIEVAGAIAVWEPYYQNPEERDLEHEQIAGYAGTHEQFE